ncbi:MAG: D-alanyl-D-alanine carboxypeptidase, partial [Candidatus Dormibacteraeota bacterium]|nr:D-alanyl-D-alanine carboxypeptidase [Candidatus Dormibacteraeota bacterium]
MKRKAAARLGALALLVALLYAAVGVYNWTRPVPPAFPLTQLPALSSGTAPALPWPPGAQAAVGADGFGILAATPDARPAPIASVAKMMTALLTLHTHPLAVGEAGPIITVTSQDVAVYLQDVAVDGSVVPVTAGEQLTEYQALQALLLPSANNVASLLGRWADGSEAAFVQRMNQSAAAMALAGTTFADASGFDPRTVSVPSDLVRLAELAMQEPVFAQIVGQASAVLPVAGTVFNVNALLGQDSVVGVKTGNSVEA